MHGESSQSCLVAVVVPDEEAVKSWAAKVQLEGTYEQIAKSKEFEVALMEHLDATGKARGLKGFEFARGLYVETQPFSVENGLLTTTFKLKRNVARERYQAELSRLYKTVRRPTME